MPRMIKPVIDNADKQRTYREHKVRYKKAMENEFYFEALLIDYALLEDRLRSMIYHMGFLRDRSCFKIWNKKTDFLKDVVSIYKEKDESYQLGISSISGKIKIVRCVLKWAAYTDGDYHNDKHLLSLKNKCEGLDIDGLLIAFEKLNEWRDYRNEVIHALMNKNIDSLSAELRQRAEEGMCIATFLDNQEKLLKRGNTIRKSAGLQMK